MNESYLNEIFEEIFKPIINNVNNDSLNENNLQNTSKKRQLRFDLPETKFLANLVFELQENLKRNNFEEVLNIIEELQDNLEILKKEASENISSEVFNKFKDELLEFLNKVIAFDLSVLTKENILETINNLCRKHNIKNEKIDTLKIKIQREEKLNKIISLISEFLNEDS